MYRPKKYIKDDTAYILSFIRQNPFATFIINGKRLLATHIPVLIDGNKDNWRLYAHIANHNEQYEFLNEEVEALVIFHGPHSYISSSWYKEKDISTWDYKAVHVNAKIRLQTREELEQSLDDLVTHFEKDQQQPLYYKDIPNKMLSEHLPLITGFWLEPFKVEGIAKLHQAYPEHDVKSVVNHLESSEDSIKQELGREIKKEHQI